MTSRRAFVKMLGIAGAGLGACGDDSGAEPDAALPGRDGGTPDAMRDLLDASQDGGPDAGDAADAGPTSSGPSPVLTRFRVEGAETSRVYFDSSKPLASGSSADGFVVTGKTLSGVSVVSGETTGHYFSVTDAFDYWDNNTIRYEGGADLADADGRGVHEFTLTYIENDIEEPAAPVDRYVSTAASGGGVGSEEDPWTIEEISSNAEAGHTVWVKAGNYGNVNVAVSQSGSSDRPIKLVGYKETTGDITSNYYTYGETTELDPAEMPMLEGVDGGFGNGFHMRGSYIIIRGFQVTHYQQLFYATSSPEGVVIDGCLGHSAGRTTVNGQSGGGNQGIGVAFNSPASNRCRVTDTTVINCSISGIAVSGEHFLLAGNKIYSDRDNMEDGEAQDYYINLDAGHSIVRNCYLERVIEDQHGGHGIAIRNGIDDYAVHYNLVERCDVIGIESSIEFRHRNVKYNVVKYCYFNRGNVSAEATYHTGGVPYIRDGASFNIFEYNVAFDMDRGIKFRDTTEELDQFGWVPAGEDNIIRGCVYRKIKLGIQAMQQGDDGTVHRTRIENCTFHELDYLYEDPGSLFTGNDNTMVNCIVSTVAMARGVFRARENFTESFCAYDSLSYEMPAGEGNLLVDPLFVDVAAGDLHLRADSPIKDAGVDVSTHRYDADGLERIDGAYSIGAYELD